MSLHNYLRVIKENMPTNYKNNNLDMSVKMNDSTNLQTS